MKKVNYKTKNLNDNARKLNTDWWDEISDEEKFSIARGLEDVKAGRVIEHDKVRIIYKSWLN